MAEEYNFRGGPKKNYGYESENDGDDYEQDPEVVYSDSDYGDEPKPKIQKTKKKKHKMRFCDPPMSSFPDSGGCIAMYKSVENGKNELWRKDRNEKILLYELEKTNPCHPNVYSDADEVNVKDALFMLKLLIFLFKFLHFQHSFEPPDFLETHYPIKVRVFHENCYKDDKVIVANKNLLNHEVFRFVQDLFDENSQLQALSDLNLDPDNFDLEKFEKEDVDNAYKVLSELADLIMNGGTSEQFIETSNRFYTLIPMIAANILDSVEEIKDKTALLESLHTIKIANTLLKVEKVEEKEKVEETEKDEDTEKDEETVEEVCKVDRYYEKLKTSFEPLDHSSEEFNMIKMYAKTLEIEDVFKLKRHELFEKLHNRQILWYSGATGPLPTNYGGILCNGLKIAPENPAMGYKIGLYFSDICSNASFQPMPDNCFCLMLCEVALGDMYELTR